MKRVLFIIEHWRLILPLSIVAACIFGGAAIPATTPVSRVQAAGYTIRSVFGCPGYPSGSSELVWNGYFPYSSGNTAGTLWGWDGSSSWVNRSSGQQGGNGGSSSAIVSLNSNGTGSAWYEAGAHSSTFFSGTQYSNSAIYNC